MTGTLLAMPVLRAVDATGAPIAGALLQFYVTGTTTPTPAYTTSALGTPLSNPVVADAGGLFAPIYLDPAVVYRVQLQTAGGSVIRDIDPVNAIFTPGANTITNAMLQAGVAVANLGYTPANKAGDTLTNSLVAFSSLAANSSGYLGLPVNEQDASYTTVLLDAGKMVRATSGSGIAYTIPPVAAVAWPVGTAIGFRNAGAGVVTMTPGAGVTFMKSGATATAATIALAQGAMVTAVMEATNAWVFSGSNMT